MKIKQVVFDWNGTLIADATASMNTDNHILDVFGGRRVNLKTYRDTIVIPSIEFYVTHGCDREQLLSQSKKWGEEFHSHYEPRVAKIRTRQNAHELLKWLAENKIDSIILSNHTVVGINSQLKRLGIEKYFSKLLANDALDGSMKGISKKEKLKIFFENSGLTQKEMIIIGDSPEEVEMGKSIGIKTVAITGGYYSTPRLRKSQPDYLINNLKELVGIIKA